MRVAGADGCRTGWIVIKREQRSGRHTASVLDSSALIALARDVRVLAVDIPIGLTEAGRRECDDAARAVLKWPRRNSVFPAPVRPALKATSREQASAITAKADGRRVGCQAWGIFRKVREVDKALRRLPGSLRDRVQEVHPEVSFWAWNGGRAMRASKKSREGRRRRLALVRAHFGADAFENVRRDYLRKEAADDDILDAFAAVWTAERIARGEAGCLPEARVPRDRMGLPMAIKY